MLEAAGERGAGGAVQQERSRRLWGARRYGRNLTKSLTKGMGFRLRMSGMLSIMISPPPGLQERGKSAGKGETEAGGDPLHAPGARLEGAGKGGLLESCGLPHGEPVCCSGAEGNGVKNSLWGLFGAERGCL